MGQRGRPSLEVGRRVNGAKCCCTETLGAFYSRYIRDSLLTKSKMAGQETFPVNLTLRNIRHVDLFFTFDDFFVWKAFLIPYLLQIWH